MMAGATKLLLSTTFKYLTMQKIRNSIFTKSLCVLLAALMFNLGCTPQTTSTDSCSSIPLKLSDTPDLPDQLEAMLELSRTLHHQNGFNSYREFYEEVFMVDELSNRNIQTFELQAERYSTLGFEGYLEEMVVQNQLSVEFHAEILIL